MPPHLAPTRFEPRHFFILELSRKMITAVVDSGAAQCYLGKGISSYLKGKFSPILSQFTVADGNSVKIHEQLDATFVIDGMERVIILGISDDLQYEGLLEVDFLRAFNVRIDYENDTWCTDEGIVRPFYSYGSNPGCITALASLGGLTPATPSEMKEIQALVDSLIPKPPKKLGTVPW